MSIQTRSFSFGPNTTTVTFGPLAAVFGEADSNALLICDANTANFADGFEIPTVVLDPGEEHKSWHSIKRIIDRALALGLGRDSVFYGLGGGVVCDMAAFAASVYMRGCAVSLVPTTLLAMVDASIGGKTGIDFSGYKNLIGSFHPAERVHIAVGTLATLPEREYKSGLAEVIKHALLGAEDLLVQIEKEPQSFFEREAKAVEASIYRSLDVKGEVVAGDLKEHGIRAHLNFGHTFGHALESATGFGVLSHGEAVAWGMDRALTAGVAAGITDRRYAERVRTVLKRYEYRTGPLPEGISADSVLAAMKHDKKKRRGSLQFVLQRELGQTLVTTLEEGLVREVLLRDQLS